MNNVRRVYVLAAAEELVEEVLDVRVREGLPTPDNLMQVSYGRRCVSDPHKTTVSA